ncbi:2467_t:CDS:2, partial [Racocetra fulgida]
TIIINNQKPKIYKYYSINRNVTVVIKDLKIPKNIRRELLYLNKISQKVDEAISYKVTKGANETEDSEVDQIVNLLYCIKNIKEIEKEIEKINQRLDEFIEESDKPEKFLKNNIL